jgi:hypothetical protein
MSSVENNQRNITRRMSWAECYEQIYLAVCHQRWYVYICQSRCH